MFIFLSATKDTGQQHIIKSPLRAATYPFIISVRLRRRNRMRYAWTKQAAIYIVCTHVYACVSELYYSVSTKLIRLVDAVLASF